MNDGCNRRRMDFVTIAYGDGVAPDRGAKTGAIENVHERTEGYGFGAIGPRENNRLARHIRTIVGEARRVGVASERSGRTAYPGPKVCPLHRQSVANEIAAHSDVAWRVHGMMSQVVRNCALAPCIDSEIGSVFIVVAMKLLSKHASPAPNLTNRAGEWTDPSSLATRRL
jgi:hypothetical protein